MGNKTCKCTYGKTVPHGRLEKQLSQLEEDIKNTNRTLDALLTTVKKLRNDIERFEVRNERSQSSTSSFRCALDYSNLHVDDIYSEPVDAIHNVHIHNI